ncbi:MAG: ABC transporter substrate-binding protein [Dictyoglomus turgidum]|uniref:Extracellular solute-binding protein family 5 n=1 Tax=Dictyoglomus turgidum (strain DSM 6724 / Z-1310) TaxID=515635 RepID=B8E3A1_DICTD|nr:MULTISPECIES: ABC transporter substrate-binding protein [Dictyoglomus]ACK42975.1 extracellular solute-binding protein family 5 [Dictyoglomus turgidum DSM 6724]HBU31039.1 ABC transporter substrate-binding protein [Dictyoglomus sp.]
MKYVKFLSILLIFILIFGNTIVGQKKYNESPMTAALVREGKLPPVEQRLPKNPIVVKPLEEVGVYGGTLRRAWMGPGDRWGIAKICYDANNLMRWASDSKTILPWLVEKYTVSKDGRVFTFKLREGLKWSDGHPMTTDDVIFWYEDVIGNEELTPTFPSGFVQDGVRAKFIKVDDYTFRIEFKNPNPMFIYTFPTQGWFIDNSKGSFAFYAPKHYLMQFHPKYTPKDKLEALAKQKGFNKWYELFQFMIDYIQNPDLPTMSPWKIVSKSPNEPVFVMERNPYYPVVDTEGNQLPYIDRVVHYLVSDAEMINMKAVAGEIDFQARHMRLPNYTLFMQNKDKGNYRILIWRTGTGADPAIYLNQNVKDPVKRKLFQDARFRQALSLAINREEINKILFFGLGVPMQAAIPPGSAYYDKAWAQAYAQYDPGRAKILLDSIGLKVGKDGFRIGPDGKPIELIVSFTTYPGSANMSTMELIKSYWEKIGIKTIIKQVDRSLYTTQCNSGDIEIGVWVMDRMSNVAISAGRLLGTWTDGPWAPLYARWYWTKGQEGEEPTGDIKKIYDLWDEFNRTVDARKRDTIIRQIIALHRKNIWIIGTVGGIPQLVIVNNKLRNVPDGILWDDPYRSELNSFPEQFFFKQ